MSILKETIWRIRAGGDETNGGGYDGVNYPGGTDYSDSDSPEQTFSDLYTSGVTDTVSSFMGPFSPDQVGNVINISGGTNFIPGYYVMIAYIDSSSAQFDRVCTTGVAALGTGKLGGAWASFINITTGGAGASPILASPLIAGNTIMLRGAGSDDPSTPDYDYSGDAGGYWIAPSGNTTEGYIKVEGYNGRPFIDLNSLFLYTTSQWSFDNIKFRQNSNIYSLPPIWGSGNLFKNIYQDQNGIDQTMILGSLVINSYLYNTGSTSPGNYPAIQSSAYGGLVENNTISNVRGYGVNLDYMGVVQGNIITKCHATAYGAVHSATGQQYWFSTLSNNTIYDNDSDGVDITTFIAVMNTQIFNNIISNNAGYGINVASLSGTAWTDRSLPFFDYNNIYNNTSGSYHNISAGSHDTSVDPLFTNVAALDFSITANI